MALRARTAGFSGRAQETLALKTALFTRSVSTLGSSSSGFSKAGQFNFSLHRPSHHAMPALSLRAIHNHNNRHSRVANSLQVQLVDCSVPAIPLSAEEYDHIHVATMLHRACQTSIGGARLSAAALLAQLHVGPPSSGQEPPSDSVYSCDLPWYHQNRRTASITHGAAKKYDSN